MKDLKIITFTNFRSGGKSSAARLLAENLNSSILNFDSERDAEHYNAINTINIQKNKTISREKSALMLSDDQTDQMITSKSGYLICDLGGYFDPRVTELESDYYVLPSFDDYESIRETLRTAKYILRAQPRAKLIFILNNAFLVNKKEKETALENFKEQLEINMLDHYKLLVMPKTNLSKKLVNSGIKKSDLIKKNPTLAYSYKNIKSFVHELSEAIDFTKE